MENVAAYLGTLDYQAIGVSIGAFLAGGTGLALLVSLGKRAFNITDINSKQWRKAVAQLSVLIWGAVLVVAEYFIRNADSSTPLAQVFGQHWPGLIVAATVVHRVGALLSGTKTISSFTSAYQDIRNAKKLAAQRVEPLTPVAPLNSPPEQSPEPQPFR